MEGGGTWERTIAECGMRNAEYPIADNGHDL